MCKWGTYIECYVPIPAELSHDGKFHWDKKPIDSCISNLVNVLNDAGIYTASCCCGHDKKFGHIWLQDGRVLIILPSGLSKDEIVERLRLK